MKQPVILLVFCASILLMPGCQSDKDMCGTWQVSTLQVKGDTGRLAGPLFIRTIGGKDFGYLEFTGEHDMNFYNKSDSLIYRGGYLLSEFGKELLIKGREDLVYKVKIQNGTTAMLDNAEAHIKLVKMQCKISKGGGY